MLPATAGDWELQGAPSDGSACPLCKLQRRAKAWARLLTANSCNAISPRDRFQARESSQ